MDLFTLSALPEKRAPSLLVSLQGKEPLGASSLEKISRKSSQSLSLLGRWELTAKEPFKRQVALFSGGDVNKQPCSAKTAALAVFLLDEQGVEEIPLDQVYAGINQAPCSEEFFSLLKSSPSSFAATLREKEGVRFVTFLPRLLGAGDFYLELVQKELSNVIQAPQHSHAEKELASALENARHLPKEIHTFPWQQLFAACEGFTQAQLAKVAEEDKKYLHLSDFGKKLFHFLEEESSFFLPTHELLDFFRFYCDILGGEEVFRSQEAGFRKIVKELERSSSSEEKIKSSLGKTLFIRGIKLDWHPFFSAYSLLVKGYEKKRNSMCNLAYGFCYELTGLLREKEQLVFQREKLLALLSALRYILIEQGYFEHSEAYLGLALQIFQEASSQELLQEQVTMLLEGGDLCLKGALQKDLYPYYQRASYYYATAYELAQKKLPEKASLAWKKLLRVEGQYLESKTDGFIQLLAASRKKCAATSKLSVGEKKGLMGQLEESADYLAARGCFSAAYELYHLAYVLSIECKLVRQDLSLRKSEMYTPFAQEELTIPEEILEKAKTGRQALQSLRAQVAQALEHPSSSHWQQELQKGFCALAKNIFARCALFLDPHQEYGYALIGLGSMSREEMSPFSDFEVALLLQEKSLETIFLEQFSKEAFSQKEKGDRRLSQTVLEAIRTRQKDAGITFEESVKIELEEHTYFAETVEQVKKAHMLEGKTFKELLGERLCKTPFFGPLLSRLEARQARKKIPFQQLVEKKIAKYQNLKKLCVEAEELRQQSNAPAQEFFRNLASLYELSILSLGETSWPILRGEKSPLPQGFSLDKSNNLFHLCSPPEKLAFRQKEAGEPVQLNVLRSSKFLMGNASLYEAYLKTMHHTLYTQGGALAKKHALQGLQDYLQIDFSALENPSSIDTKKDLLRFPVFVMEALCLYHDLPTNCSTKEKIALLTEKGILSPVLQAGWERFLDHAYTLRAKAHLQAKEEEDSLELEEGEKELLATSYTTLLKPLQKTLSAWLFALQRSEISSQEPSFWGDGQYFVEGHLEEMQKRIAKKQFSEALIYLDRAIFLQESLEYSKISGALHFAFGEFDQAKAMWQKAHALLEKEGASLADKKPPALLEKIKEFPFLQEKALGLKFAASPPDEKTICAKLILLAEEQHQVRKGLQEGFAALKIPSALPDLSKALCEKGLEAVHLEELLARDWVLFWRSSLIAWLQAVLAEEKPCSLFTQVYNILPQGYSQEIRSQLFASFHDRLFLLEQFACEEGCIFAPLVKRSRWQEKLTLAVTDSSLEPSSKTSTAIEGVHLRKTRLSEEKAQNLFDEREFISKITWANRPVNESWETYFKKNPESPGDEYAVFLLNHLITAQGSPPVDLLRIVHQSQEHLVLASEKIEGTPLHKVFSSATLSSACLSKLDRKQFSQSVLMALLIDPEDGKADNYIVQTEQDSEGEITWARLICVDNDHVFVRPFVKKGFFAQEQLFIKTVLFCFDQMQEEIDPEVREAFLKLNPTALLEEWLGALVFYNTRVEALFKEETLNGFWKEGVLIPFFMHPSQLIYLHEKMLRIQRYLAKENRTHIALLNHLDIKVGSFYQSALEKKISVKKRFDLLTEKAYRRKEETSFTDTTTAQIKEYTLKTPLKEMAQFRSQWFTPEEGLKVLKALRTERGHTEKIDWDQVDVRRLLTVPLQERMLKEKDWAYMPSSYLGTVDKIPFRKVCLKHFIALEDKDFERFIRSSTHPVTEQIELRTVNLQGCTSLTSKSGVTLSQYCTRLQKVNLEATSLTLIKFTSKQLPYLRRLNLKNCRLLQTVDVRSPTLQMLLLDGCSQLKTLSLDTPILSYLGLQGCPALTSYQALGTTPLTSALFFFLKNLQEHPEEFVLRGSIDQKSLKMFFAALYANTQLKKLRLDLHETFLKEIDLSGHTALSSLHINSNWVESLHLNQIPFLQEVDIRCSHLKELYLQENPEIKTLALTTPNLEWLYLRGSEVEQFLPSAKTKIEKKFFPFLHILQNISSPQEQEASIKKRKKRPPLISVATLIHLCLEGKREFSQEMAQNALKDALQRHPGLKNLIKHSSFPNDKELQLIARRLYETGKEAVLGLSQENLRVEEVKVIARALPHFEKLTVLSLWGDRIEDEGAVALAAALPLLSRLEECNLCENKIGALGAIALAEGLKKLSSLRSLNLNSNQIGDKGAVALAGVFPKLKRLSGIGLNSNKIGDEGAIVLGKAFLDCPQLIELVLIQNEIGPKGGAVLGAAFEKFSQMTSVVFWGNHLGAEGITSLASSITALKLTVIDLSWSRMGDEGASALAAALSSFPQLTTLCLSKNEIGVEGVTSLAQALPLLTKLTVFSFSENNLQDKGAQALAPALEKLLSLKELWLGKNEIGDEGMLALTEAFPHLPELKELYLEENKIKDRGLEGFIKVKGHLSKLTLLYLENNGFGDTGATALSAALENFSQLEELHLQQNNIGDEGAVALAKALAELPLLKKLYLHKNKIKDKGFAALGKTCSHLIALENLFLWGNTFGYEGAVALAEALFYLPKLQHLELSQNQIGDKGICALALSLGSLSQLKSLQLEESNMGDEGALALAKALPKLSELKEIHLHQNKIGDLGIIELARAFCDLKQLTKLVLWDNRIGDKGATILIEQLTSLPKIEYLDLAQNKITGKGVAAFATSLSQLDLSEIRLHKNPLGDRGALALAKNMRKFSHVEAVYLCQCDIGDKGAAALVKAMDGFVHLTKLSLWGNRIGDAGARVLVDFLDHLPQFKELELTKNRISDEGMQAVSRFLQKRSFFTALKLHENKIGDKGAIALAEVLPQLSQLKELYLYKNNIGDQGIAALAQSLPTLRDLEKLSIWENAIGAIGAKALSQALEHLPKLVELVLSRNPLEDAGAIVLASTLPKCTLIKELHLETTGIGDEGATALAPVLPHLSHLEVLNLSFNKITDQGAIALAKALPHLPIRECNLGWNTIGDEGVIALAFAFSRLKELKYMFLHRNQVGDEGARALAKIVSNLSQLRNLYLWDNKIGDEGASTLIQALYQHPQLQELELSRNQISSRSAAAFAQFVGPLSAFIELHIAENPLGDEGAVALAQGDFSKLKKIYLWDNEIGDTGATALAQGLKQALSLEEIVLKQNRIGKEGAKALAKGIKFIPQLKEIYLGENSIEDEGVLALAQSLECLSDLKELYLSENRISDIGAKALASSLKYPFQLKELSLEGNAIGDEGVLALTPILTQASSLERLDLSRNHIGDSGAKALAQALTQALELRTLYLWGNQIGDEGIEALSSTLKELPCLSLLGLSHDKIASSQGALLIQAIRDLSQVEEIYLWDKKAFAIAQGTFSDLKKEVLFEGGSGKGFKALIETATHFSYTKKILSDQISHALADETHFSLFTQELQHISHLIFLDLGKCVIDTNYRAAFLADALKATPKIVELPPEEDSFQVNS